MTLAMQVHTARWRRDGSDEQKGNGERMVWTAYSILSVPGMSVYGCWAE